MNWKDRLEIVYWIAGSISAIGTVVAAAFAVFVYTDRTWIMAMKD